MIEKKKVILNEDDGDYYISDLLSFGYELVYEDKEKIGKETVRVYMFERDNEMANYDKIVELEKEYEDNKKELLPIPKVDGLLAFFLWCFILPGLLYYDSKQREIKAVDEHNLPFAKRMYEITLEANKLKGNKASLN